MSVATSHNTEQIKESIKDDLCKYRLIPPGLTSYCPPYALYLNKPFKDHLKKRYWEFCLDNHGLKRPESEDLIRWVYDVCYSDDICKVTIINFFKKAGINFKWNDSEYSKFEFPSQLNLKNEIIDAPPIKYQEEVFDGNWLWWRYWFWRR